METEGCELTQVVLQAGPKVVLEVGCVSVIRKDDKRGRLMMILGGGKQHLHFDAPQRESRAGSLRDGLLVDGN